MRKLIFIIFSISFCGQAFSQFSKARIVGGGVTGPASVNAVSGDVNGDGLLDLVFQAPSFTAPKIHIRTGITSAPYFSSIAETIINRDNAFVMADFDGDSDLDIVSYAQNGLNGSSGDVELFKNDGFGNFDTPPTTIPTPGDAGARIAVTDDIDQDGDLDIVYTVLDANSVTFPQGVVWLENDGSGNFTDHIISTSEAYAIDIKDLDSDTDKDIWVTQVFNDEVSIFLNTNNSFNLLASVPVREFPSQVKVADLDNDGDMDFLTSANDVTRYITLYQNEGTTPVSFEEISINAGAYPSTNIVLEDFDTNGTLDIIWCGASFGTGNAGWFSNDGNSVFSDQGTLISAISQTPSLLVPVNVNDDDFIDFVGCSRVKSQSYLAINNAGSSISKLPFHHPLEIFDPVSIDGFQNDSDDPEELVVVNAEQGYILILDELEQANIGISFIYTGDFSGPKQGEGLDADGDGDADVLALFNQGLVLFTNSGGTYTTSVLEDSEEVDVFETTDVNGDGRRDIIASIGVDTGLFIWYGGVDGYGERNTLATNLSSASSFSLAVSSGGAIDFGVVYMNLSNEIINLPYIGNDDFGSGVILHVASMDIERMQVADINSDENPDLVGYNSSGVFSFTNDGLSQLGNAVLLFSGTSISDFFITDFTRDGVNDILVFNADNNGYVGFLSNDGSGGFSLTQQAAQNFVSTVEIADLDGDGDSDIAVGKNNSQRILIGRNNYIAPSELLEPASTALVDHRNVQIFPNPVNSAFRISEPQNLKDDVVQLSIRDMNGKQVYQASNLSKYEMVTISDLPPGNYVVAINEPKAKITHFVKLIKE